MGYKQSPALIVVALLLLATATPLAYGQTLLLNPTGFVTGSICCDPSGNCPPGAVGIQEVAVRLNCTTLSGNVATLAQGVTNSTGVFNLTLPNLLGFLGPLITTIPSCNVFANLPLESTDCPNVRTVGRTLTGSPVLLSAYYNSLGSPIYNFLVPVFNVVSIS